MNSLYYDEIKGLLCGTFFVLIDIKDILYLEKYISDCQQILKKLTFGFDHTD